MADQELQVGDCATRYSVPPPSALVVGVSLKRSLLEKCCMHGLLTGVSRWCWCLREDPPDRDFENAEGLIDFVGAVANALGWWP